MGVCLDKDVLRSVSDSGNSTTAPENNASGPPETNKPAEKTKGSKTKQFRKQISSAFSEKKPKEKPPDDNGVAGREKALAELLDPESGIPPLSSVEESYIEKSVALGHASSDVSPSVSLPDESGKAKMSNFPQLTKPAPDFCGQAVVNGAFKEIKLADYKGKYLVLFFYPLDFTFVCPTEIISFSEKAEDFRKINCEVVACSTDSQYSHFAWINTSRKQGGLGSMNIPLLADKTGEISRNYGCYKEDEGIAFRGLYIIDDKGRLRQITINDLPVGRSVEETLRLVQAFQFTDKYGEVCPANWKPGDKTMKPEPDASKEYFEEKH